VEKVSTKEVKTYGSGTNNIVVVDCGVKHAIFRHLLKRDTKLTVVPFDYDYTKIPHDGVFLSNGPGDPNHLNKTVEILKKSMQSGKPHFGICMGNQLIGLAAGGSVGKMPFGNRGHNQPVLNQLNNKAHVTSQNHGYAIDMENIDDAVWAPLFKNLNDGSNEGIIHKTLPFMSAQFHPEARGGPNDTFFMFDQFVTQCRQQRLGRPVANFFKYPGLKTPRKVLVLGSGGLSIGQAGEFDYSGSQALKSYASMGCETVLINPNIASLQTSKGMADSVYYLPVTVDFVTDIIKKEKPDAITLSFGGQTALNVGCMLAEQGILKEHGVEVLGTSVESVHKTEDRKLFVDKLTEINEPTPVSIPTNSVEEAVLAANKVGYPVICRAAYALGGLGSGFCKDEAELRELTGSSFTKSPQVLVERDLRGWKEVEYEVVRDAVGNCITVCNMENFDPLGIHTGDSIVVAPSQTLTNDEYHLLRESSINIASHLGIVGECNVQYALHPESLEYAVIEANPRLSRSSALASKATGYPLAAVAAQLSLGVTLPQLDNPITSSDEYSTSAFFEPSLDYCVVKLPRWDTSKFEGVSNLLNSAMRSVGEVMSIGRTFEEALQKAVRMVGESNPGFEPGMFKGVDKAKEISFEGPTPNRLFAIADEMYSGKMDIDSVHEASKIDKWFLEKLDNIVKCSNAISGVKDEAAGFAKALGAKYDASGITASDEQMPPQHVIDVVRRAKEHGFSDKQIASRWGVDELDVRAVRVASGVVPAVKQIDTLGGEYPATSNYLYTTYNGRADDITFDEHGTLVLGSGVYRIGSSVEFDYCSMKAVKALQEMGRSTIMLNHNPETVSTDYDESDRLYFDELSYEKVLDIYEREKSEGIVVSVGGQAPNNIALKLQEVGAKVLGTHPTQIDRCEDRSAYSAMLDKLGINQPAWLSVLSTQEAHTFCESVGYPVIVRPSYVLSGAAMAVVHGPAELATLLDQATEVSPDYPVCVSKFIDGAFEVDLDAVASNGTVVCHAISEHLERGGVHSGDATLVLPSFRLSESAKQKMKDDAAAIAKELSVSGPFNTQFLVRPQNEGGEWVGVIETNLRASRSVPFVSKVLGVDFIKRATACIVGADTEVPEPKCDTKLSHVGVKCPQFSFQRLIGADPVLGVEMRSTGEVACFGETVEEAYLKSLTSAHFKVPPKGSRIMLCARDKINGDLDGAMALVNDLANQGYVVVAADESTKDVLQLRVGLDVQVAKRDAIQQRAKDRVHEKISLVLDLSENHKDFYNMRRNSVDFSIPLVTNAEQASLLSRSLSSQDKAHIIKNYDEYVKEIN